MKINSEFEKLYSCIEFKFAYDEIYKTLNSLKMIDEEVVSKNLTARIIRPNQEMIKRTKKLMNYYKGIIAKIDADYHLILENEEKIIIDSFRKQLLEFESKYVIGDQTSFTLLSNPVPTVEFEEVIGDQTSFTLLSNR